MYTYYKRVLYLGEGKKLLEAKIINLAMTGKGFAIVLKVEQQDKVLPIVIATTEAQSILVSFLKFKQDRPSSHDLLKNIIEMCSIDLKYVFIDSVKDELFTAKLVLQQGENIKSIDSRPSDAIVLSLNMKAKIFVDEAVLEMSGVFLEDITTINPNSEIPFKYANFDEHLASDITLNDIARTSSMIFKKYSHSDLDKDCMVGVESEEILHENRDVTCDSMHEKQRNIDKLEKLLKLAIKEERYEDAANYRDELSKYQDI